MGRDAGRSFRFEGAFLVAVRNTNFRAVRAHGIFERSTDRTPSILKTLLPNKMLHEFGRTRCSNSKLEFKVRTKFDFL